MLLVWRDLRRRRIRTLSSEEAKEIPEADLLRHHAVNLRGRGFRIQGSAPWLAAPTIESTQRQKLGPLQREVERFAGTLLESKL